MQVLPEEVARFVRAAGPEGDAVHEEMLDHAAEQDFPIVGPEVGGFLQVLARLTDARRIFEFGSGFGYSAYWFARGMAPDGRIVLTEHDPGELARAREFLDRAGVADRAAFEGGDAIEVVEDYEGPFDVVLIDLAKPQYPEAFAAVRGKVPRGGVVVADNVLAGPVDFADLLAHVEGDRPAGEDRNGGPDLALDADTRGIASFLDAVSDDPAFERAVLPLGEGVAVNVRVE